MLTCLVLWPSEHELLAPVKERKAKIVFLDNNIERLVVISLITFLRFAYHFLFCFYKCFFTLCVISTLSFLSFLLSSSSYKALLFSKELDQ